jgi:hypothetical protein
MMNDEVGYLIENESDLFGSSQLLEKLLSSRNGLKVHSIHFVKAEVLSRSPKDQLESVGLKDLEPIYFKVRGLFYSRDETLSSTGDRKGSTINLMINGLPEQTILITKEPPRDENLSEENCRQWINMNKLIALVHELGHVEDMRLARGSNFSYGANPTVDLVEAESYAHSYCLNYLNAVGAYTARNTLAVALHQLNKSTTQFEKELYRSVCKRVGKGRIKKWSNN